MKDRPTPETDAFFRSFADGDAAPSHAEYYDRMTQLERERDEARAELEQAKQDAKQRDESLRLLGKWEQVAIGAGERVLELTKQRDTLATAAKLIADEYKHRRCQFGGDYLWTKHEQTEAIENALAIINKHHHDNH